MPAQPFPKHRNVFRIETSNTVGWQVRIERQKKKYSKFFSDSLHDGPKKGLTAALAWRDTQLDALPAMSSRTAHLHTDRIRRRTAEALNRTGVIGIGFSMFTQKSGVKNPYVTCHWRDPETGRRCSTSFSVKKHGLARALRMACQRLREGRGESPTPHQVDYYVKRARPAIRRLYAEAVGEAPHA